jgi:UTP--glucose-1-phosphate uridylyltransferase
MVAIIPAAGEGRRMAGVTGGAPKELLTVGGKAVLERVLDEAFEAGAQQAAVVTSAAKPGIEAFVRMYGDSRVRIAYQESARGLAHAVSCADVSGSPALAMMADVFFEPHSPSRRLAEALLERRCWACVAVRQVAPEDASLYGVVVWDEATLRASRIVEKPPMAEGLGSWVVAGRFGLSDEAMEVLHAMAISMSEDDPYSSLSLSDVLQLGIDSGRDVLAIPLEEGESLYDCGEPANYETAVSELGA